jgi:hypothetical protein
MSEPLPHLIEKSIQIAWDYLERTGEIEDESEANRFLMRSVDQMVMQGERRRLMLANRAIDAYRHRNCGSLLRKRTRRRVAMPDKPINGREPEFSEEDIQREELGPRGVPGKESPAKMTPQAEKNTPRDPDTGYTQ